jgi:hypothetical protein
MTNPDSAAPRPQPHAAQIHRPPSRFSGLGTVALLIGTVVVFALAFLFVMDMRQLPQGSEVAAGGQGDLASLRDRLASDEARLATSDKGGTGDAAGFKASLQQAQTDLAALSARIAKLETAPDPQAAARLDDLDKQLAAMRSDFDFRMAALERNALNSDLPRRVAALATAQAALDARTAKLERTDPSLTMRRAAAELALVNLVRASSGSAPFAAELLTFRGLMPEALEADELVPISLKGAPTRVDLAGRFPDVAAKALADETGASAKSWLGRLWNNIGNLIVVRRVGDTQGADSGSILARAGSQLNRGDLAGAIAQMSALKGTARASARPWLNDAQARLAIERDTAAMANRMTTILAAP